jgi:hypothetical protein
MGRPKRNGDKADASQAEYKKITVRPTPEQLDELNARAASFGYKSLSKYLIERGLKEGEMIESIDRERIERLLFEVRKVGVNINQIAREMHRGYSEYSQAHLDRAMRQVERIVKEIAEEITG